MATSIDGPTYTARRPIPHRDLMPLTTVICNRLPRELRDIVYDFILDDATLRMVHDGAFPLASPGTESLILPYNLEKKYWPAFLLPRSVHETFRIELVERYRTLNRGFTVRNGQNLYTLLAKGLFQTSFCYAEMALSTLVFDTSFYAGATLAPILYGQQALANDFTLFINIHTGCVTPSRPSDHLYIGFMQPFQNWAYEFGFAYPTLRKIKEMVEMTGTKRKVQMWIKMPRMPYEDGPWLEFPVQKEMGGWVGYQWWIRVKTLLKDMHGIE